MTTKPSESRIGLVLRTVCALPMFLLLTLIFWQLVLGAWLHSGWLYARGWPALGLSFKIVWTVVAALTVASTVLFFVSWMVQLIFAIRRKN